MKNSIVYFGFIILLISACNHGATTNEVQKEKQAKPQQIALKSNEFIRTGKIQQRTMSKTIQCTGRIEIPPAEINSIHAKASGQLTVLKYHPGDYVKKGTLLAKVENPILIEKQRILLETKANLAFAKKDFERKKILMEGQATPEKTFDESKNRFELLTATYEGLKQELLLLGIEVVKLEQERAFQSTIPVRASHAGHIQAIKVNKGQMVTPETCIMDIVDTDHLHLELQILSKDVDAIKMDQEVMFTLPNSEDQFLAKIAKISPMVDEETATLQVHCHLEYPNKNLFVAGLFVNAKVKAGEEVLQGLPISAVVKESEAYYGYKIIQDKKVKTELLNARIMDDFVIFEGDKSGKWVVEGAYYVE